MRPNCHKKDRKDQSLFKNTAECAKMPKMDKIKNRPNWQNWQNWPKDPIKKDQIDLICPKNHYLSK